MEEITIKYGIETKSSIDITKICFELFLSDDKKIHIPSTDFLRGLYFSDPLVGFHKKIIISINDKKTEYDINDTVSIDLVTMKVSNISEKDIDRELKSIHDKLKISFGSFGEELPEQRMSIRFLTGDEKILEIGGNIGRNSLVIASILKDPSNLVVLESDPGIASLLIENRNINGLPFKIENAALSKRKLIQSRWDTKPSEILEHDHFWVNTITLDDLKSKHNIVFDTLVLDCEGAFYYILQDFPEILDNIKLIIVENDYQNFSHKIYVDNYLKNKNFRSLYCEEVNEKYEKHRNVWHIFFEVWKRF